MVNKIKSKINKWKTRGAVAPSSKYLVNKMISKIDYSKDMEILQLGFGTGVFTKQILEKLSPKSKLVIFEVDEKYQKYKISDNRIIYIQDSAENISKYFKDKKFDHIISTLPFASLPKNIVKSIQDEIKIHLKTGGKFLQFQYSLYSKREIKNVFEKPLKIYFEFLNIPPAFIYVVQNG